MRTREREGRGPGPTIEDLPFRALLERDAGLADARRYYAAADAAERRMAADLEYGAAAAADAFRGLLPPLPDPWRSTVLALAIDPTYAPALLTVGTLEHELGRRGEALDLLLELTALPADTEDLAVIIDKAGQYLVDREDVEGALALYEAAARAFPEVAAHQDSVSWCRSELGLTPSADECADRAPRG